MDDLDEQESDPNSGGTAEVTQQQRDEVHRALATESESLVDLPSERPFLAEEREDWKQNTKLKRLYAIWLLAGLGVQIAVVDTVLFMYAWKGVHWMVDRTLISIWLSATVVEVIGVVVVVTRHLFPRRDQS